MLLTLYHMLQLVNAGHELSGAGKSRSIGGEGYRGFAVAKECIGCETSQIYISIATTHNGGLRFDVGSGREYIKGISTTRDGSCKG